MDFAHALRAKYPDAAVCSSRIDHRPIAPVSLSVRTMNFGQHWRTDGVVSIEYELELPRQFLIDYLSKELPDYIDDARQFPDSSDKLENELERLRWPTAENAIKNAELALQLIIFFGYELMRHWLGDGVPDLRPGYILNSIDKVCIQDNRNAILIGKAAPAASLARYQDI